MAITVNIDLPTDNTDVLSGTLLDPVPGPGVLSIYLASSQRDGVLSVIGPGGVAAFRVAPVLRTSGIPDLSADMPFVMEVVGGKLLVNYDEVTAGDAFSTFIFQDADEL
jgi:hypothetical protein